MMARSLANPFLSLAIGAIAVAGGCNCAAWERKKEERLSRIHKHGYWYADYDAAGVERFEKTAGLIRKRRCYHEEHLEKTSSLVRKEMESDRRRWCEERPKRRAFARRQWCGCLGAIPDTWAKMAY